MLGYFEINSSSKHLTMTFEQASQGEGKKRRSFLPAPKKSSGASPTSPQATYNIGIFHPQPSAPGPQTTFNPPSTLSSSTPRTRSPTSFSSTSSSSYDDRERTKDIDTRSTSSKGDKPTEGAFGIGLRVGARVKIGGVKPGILRYLGTTHLAPGIFCGIELYDSDGNHDGEVNGHRYFSCAPRRGIFAPKEKVCLDISGALGRLASDSDNCYSSNESLSERTYKAFKSYEEGELEAIDCSKLSPEEREQLRSIGGGGTLTRSSRKNESRAALSSTYNVLDISQSSESLDYQDAIEGSQKRLRSGLPRVKSNLPAAPSLQSKLPTFSRSYTKYGDITAGYQPSPVYSSQISQPPVPETGSKHRHSGVFSDSDQERDRASPKFRSGSGKSSEDSEEDGFARDALSTGIKRQLRADSRQYLNFTFDPEEANQSLDQEDSSESDTNLKGKNVPDPPGNAANPIYDDPRFMRNISTESSDDSLGILPPGILEKNGFLEGEATFTSTPKSSRPTKSEALRSESYTIAGSDVKQRLDMSHSNSETDEEARLDVTHSISDSDLPLETLPCAEDRRAGECSAGHGTTDDDRISEGGYGIEKNSGDGISAGLNLTQTLATIKSESYIISHTQSDTSLHPTQSYTVCSKDNSTKETESTVRASHSYTVCKTDSATSSPAKKYRKISTGSSANDGCDSSSSGTEPKTDSSGENKGETLDDSSTGVSPEVSQALEWDYGQEFDGKIPTGRQENTMTTSASTGTSESLSDVLRDVSEQSDGLMEMEMPSSVMDDSDQFETPDNEFESIDSLDDFPIFGRDAKTVMTDSGISDKSFEFCPNKSSSSTVCGNSSDECSREDDASSHTTTRAVGSDSSQETLAAEYVADTPGSIEDKEFLCDEVCASIQVPVPEARSRGDSFGDGNSNSPASVVSMEEVSALHDKTLVLDDGNEKMDIDHESSSHDGIPSPIDEETSPMDSGETALSTSPNGMTVDGAPGLGDDDFDSEGRAVNRKERPMSLLSTTSADTGYAPDTDSELGTLTTTTPNTDWVDKMGFAHPTTFAPLDEFGDHGTRMLEVDDQDQLHDRTMTMGTPTASPPLQMAGKASDDDDYNSDLTGNTEDDRIEADQLYGLKENDSTEKRSSTPELPPPDDIEDGGEKSEALTETSVQQEQGGNENVTIDSSASSPREGEDTVMNKDESSQRKSRPKKPTVTKKRSENVDHKMPNINVTSRLADYIKAPTPVKPKEEKEESKKKLNKNVRNAVQKRLSVVEISNKPKNQGSRSSSVDRVKDGRETSVERERVEKPEKPKPIIKRTPPKSKWGNIMSQIEASKDTVKPKPKSEIKSSLAAYLNTPPPSLPNTDNNADEVNGVKMDQPPENQKKREFKSRIKPLPPPPPKIDFSKIKSKLNVPTAASVLKSAPKRDSSPKNVKAKKVISKSRDNSPANQVVSAAVKDNHIQDKRMSDGNIILVRQSASASVSSAKSSRTDLSRCESVDSVAESKGEEGIPSKRGSVDLTKKDRRLSTNSVKSEHSERVRASRGKIRVSIENGRPPRPQVKSTIPPQTNNKVTSRAVEIRIRDGSAVSSQRSSPTPVILKPIKPKPKSTTVSPAKPVWGKSPAPSTATTTAKGRDSGGNQTRKPRVNGTIKATISTRPTSSATSPSQKEIERLTSLCESRTKELTHTKMQLKATTQGFDAMAVLVNYCCAELDAFECPALAKKLETVQRQLTDCLSQIADLTSQKEMLDKNLAQVTQEKEEASKQVEEALKASESEKESHAKQTSDMDKSHNAALTTQRDDLNAKHEEALKKNRQYYDRQIELLKQAHERQISDMKNESKLEMNGIRISHLEEIQELRNKHDSQMEELHKQHRNKLEDITHRFESIKLTLSEKVESLRGECDDLRHRARSSEEALQRDADVKVQMALTPFLNLPKEIESLKTVVEMRNEEIQRLRTKNMDLEKQLEEIPIGREKIISLQQKVENLEAIINIKTDHEKQLHEKCQILMRKYDREARANKRLSMDYEQVMWRMSQSSEFGSCESLTKRQLSRSPPRSERGSPESRNRNRSPNASGDVVMRKKRNSKSASDSGERRIRCRSETFVCEKHESSDSHSPSSSPQPKQKKLRNTLQPNGNGDESDKNKIERMCKSAGPEVLSDMSRDDETWVEQEDGVALKDMCDSQGLKTSSEMANSYARSVSGVSDSGVYDSLSRSELLNSSIVSTDSEWASASANLSMTLDSTMDDFESGPRAGDYSTLNNSTVVHQDGSISETSSNASLNSVGKAVSSSTKQNHSERNGETSTEGNSYSFQVSIPEDSVFDEKATIETYSYSLTDPEGHNVSDSKAIMEGLSANNPDCDVSVSVSQPAANAELTSSPIISSDKSA